MKTLFTFILLFYGIGILSTASAQLILNAPTGGRVGVHGMVLVGQNGNYFIEHIPMLSAPHDFQMVARVVLKQKDGSLITDDFSQGTFTILPSLYLKPLKFSLNDLLNHDLKIQGFDENTFPAAVYSGSFEQSSGRVIGRLKSILVQIQKIELARPLPSESTIQSFAYGGSFRTNIITSERNQQQITNLKSGTTLWCVKGPDFSEPCTP